MRKICIILMSLLCAVGVQAKGTYVIKGKISTSFDGKSVSLSALPNGKDPISTTLIKQGTFTFKGVADANKVYFIVLGKKESIPVQPVFPEEGTINVTMGEQPVIGGTKLNDACESFSAYKAKNIKPAYAAIQNYYSKLVHQNQATKAKEDSIEKEWNKVAADEDSKMNDMLKTYPNTAYAAFLLYEYQDDLSISQADSLLNGFSPALKEQPVVEAVQKQLVGKKHDAVGATYTDLAMKSPDGKDVKLSDYVGKNKYVLVDFWASWCGPCRREMPNVVAAYAKYHDKGFEVVGVSFDEQHTAWTNALPVLKMTWPQMSDLKGWSCAAHEVYGINAIPASILIDQNGKIVAKDLRGDELDKKLSELF